MIFEPELETMPRDELAELQLERLQALVARVRERVPLYAERLADVDASDIGSLDDLARLPFTRKDDLRDTYPLGMLATPRAELARIHASSGTTGKPTVVAYTATDLDLFARMNARTLAMAGAEPGMTLHNAYGYGLFTGGLGLHGGGERLGLNVVPVSGGMTERQLTLIEDLRPDVISCTPSYALTLAHAFAERGLRPDEISLRFAVVGAEPWTERMREEIDAGLGVRCTNIFGLSEVIGPGVSCECVEERAGSHVNEDHFLPEIVDPESGEPLAEGEEGVLVIHHADEGGAAARPLLDGRHLLALHGAVLVRPHARPHGPDRGAQRRHAHHPRRQRVPEPGGRRARPDSRALAALRARRPPRGHARRGRGPRGAARQ